jgi:hypothetical protein
VSVSIVLDEATPLLEAVQNEAQAKGLALVAARAVGGLVREHLYGLDSARHRGGRHFYRQAGDSVHSAEAPQGAIVSITHLGFRQRLLGGTIRARNAKNLTIPATAEAQGKRAGEFNDLDWALAHNPKTGALQPALVRRPQTVIRYSRRKNAEGGVSLRARGVMTLLPEVMFWLTPSVEQRADRSVLPRDQDINATALGAIERRFLRLKGRTTPPTGSAPSNS